MTADHAPSTKSIYKIKIKGILDSSWSDWFDGFTITHQEHQTLLVGSVTDQSALLGILTKISQLNLTILSIINLENEHVEKGD
jgi:hypothetical protein